MQLSNTLQQIKELLSKISHRRKPRSLKKANLPKKYSLKERHSNNVSDVNEVLEHRKKHSTFNLKTDILKKKINNYNYHNNNILVKVI